MSYFRVLLPTTAAVLAASLLLLRPPHSHAYVEAAHSFGQIIAQSSNIVLMRVTSIDRTRNAIIFAKVRDLKGVHKQTEIRHNIGTAGFEPREWKSVMAWADVGKEAVFFHNGSASETCIGTYWYQAYGNPNDLTGWWGMSHAEPYLNRSFAGRIDKLVSACIDVDAGKEVVVPCMVDGNLEALKAQKARIQRLKASLKLQNYDPKRDFVGWGGEDFRRVQGMPGFTHISTLSRVDPDAQSISTVDFDGDGKADLCLAGAGRVALLKNDGEALGEVSLPNSHGSRAAVWADYNADGLPDLLMATQNGPKLFTNLGKGTFRDDSHLLPKEAGYNLTCAAWIDQDGDGRPDVLLGNGWYGLRLYRNKGKAKDDAKAKPKDKAPAITWDFDDVSDAVGLGEKGVGGPAKGDTLTVVDLDGDGKQDFLYGAGSGVVAKNTGKAFEAVADSGIRYRAGKVGPVFGDYDGDGRPDLFVPQEDGCKLFRNEGNFRFSDVTKASGLAALTARCTSAAWGDVDNDGRVDLMIGCLRGPNRYFRGKGDGTFEDASEKLGLNTKVFNTQAVCLTDLNGDGVTDVVFNNEGQDPVVLLGDPLALTAKRTPVSLAWAAKSGVGGRVRVLDAEGKLAGYHAVSGGDGRGGQASPVARFALSPGKYRLEVLLSGGEKRDRELVVAGNHVRATLE